MCLSVREHISAELYASDLRQVFYRVLNIRSTLRRRCDTSRTSVLWTTPHSHVMQGHLEARRYRCSEWRHCVVVRRITPLLRRIGCVVSLWAPRLDEFIVQGVPGTESAMRHCLTTPPPYRGHFGIARYVRLSVPWRSCLGYRHAGCLQLSHRRPPETCGQRTRPRTDVDPPQCQCQYQCQCRIVDFAAHNRKKPLMRCVRYSKTSKEKFSGRGTNCPRNVTDRAGGRLHGNEFFTFTFMQWRLQRGVKG